MRTVFLALVMTLLSAVSALSDWQNVDIRGIHYAPPRNALEPGQWPKQLQQTDDCVSPCAVAFDDRMSAVHLRYKWMQLNPADGVYDFSDLGAVLDIIKSSGKKATLVVMAGKYTPPWVFENGAGYLKTQYRGKESFAQNRVPLPWDPIFLAAHGKMIAALSAYLRENPSRYRTLGLVKTGGLTSHSGEIRLMPPSAFLPRSDKGDANKVETFRRALCADYAAAGYSEKKILQASATMNRQISQAFPDQYLGLAFVTGSVRFPTVKGSGKCSYPKKNSTLIKVIMNMVSTYGRRAIINSTVLTGNSGNPKFTKRVVADGGQIGFQLNAQSVGCRRTGAPCNVKSFKQAVQAGIDAGAVFVEVHDGNIHRYQSELRVLNAAMQAGKRR